MRLIPSEVEMTIRQRPEYQDPERDKHLRALEDQWHLTGSYNAMDCINVIRGEPFSIDAYVMLSDIETLSLKNRTLVLERGLFASRLLLGEQFMEEERGNFYGLLETRPHMRLLQRKMLIQAKQGNRGATIQTGWEIVDLNTNDNLGARAVLMDHLLKESDIVGAKRLMALFPDDTMPSITYGSVLVALSEGRDEDAWRALRKADMFQPYVVRALLGETLISDEVGGGRSPMGGTTEAMDYITYAGDLWTNDPAAMVLLNTYAASRPEDWDRLSAIRSGEWRNDGTEDDPDAGH